VLLLAIGIASLKSSMVDLTVVVDLSIAIRKMLLFGGMSVRQIDATASYNHLFLYPP
jgi:hypothetical protein